MLHHLILAPIIVAKAIVALPASLLVSGQVLLFCLTGTMG